MKKSNIIGFVIIFVFLNLLTPITRAQQVSLGWENAFVTVSNIDTRSRDGIIKSVPISFTSVDGWATQILMTNNTMGGRIDTTFQLNLENIPTYIDTFDGRADYSTSIAYFIGYRLLQNVNFAGVNREIGFTIYLVYYIDLGRFGAGPARLSGLILERQEFTIGGPLELFSMYGIKEIQQLEIDIFASLVNIDGTKYFTYNLALYVNRTYVYDQINRQFYFSAGNCYITWMRLNLYHGHPIMANAYIKPSIINLPHFFVRALHSTFGSYPSRVSNYFPPLFTTEFIVVNEQTLPENTITWNYNSYGIRKKQDINNTLSREYSVYNETLNETETKIYEYSFLFSELEVYSVLNPYYINTQFINPTDWGNWEIRMFQGTAIEAVLSFNWLRNGLVFVVNAIVILFQAIFYLVTMAIQFLLVQLFLWLIVIVWNYPIYWIYFGLVGIVFFISFFFVWLWNQAVILWKLVIEPLIAWIVAWLNENVWIPLVAFVREFAIWFRDEGLIIFYAFVIIVLSYVVAAILFVISLGSVPYNDIFTFVLQLNWSIFLFFYETFILFITNILTFLQFMALYFIALGFLLMKLIYAKAKGYTSRVEKLQSAINFYKYPIDLAYRLIQMFIGLKTTDNT